MPVKYLFACGMRRSGSTLQYELASAVVRHFGLGRGVWYVERTEFAERRREWDQEPGMKVVKVHHLDPDIQAAFEAGDAIGCYVYRDPRDVLVSLSLRARYRGKLVIDRDGLDWMRATVYELNADHSFWMAMPRMLITRYADLVDDVAGEVQRIARHLGHDLSRITAELIAAEHTPAQLMALGKLPDDHVNDGRAGMWRDHVTPQQAELLKRVIRQYGQALPLEKAPDKSLESVAVRGGA